MRSYQRLLGNDGSLIAAVLRDDGAVIPDDPGNRDRHEYQLWVTAGNTPQAATPIVKHVIAVAALLARFSAAEQAALWTALSSRPQALGALMLHLADAVVDLTGARIKALLDALVTAGVLTPAREIAILTP